MQMAPGSMPLIHIRLALTWPVHKCLQRRDNLTNRQLADKLLSGLGPVSELRQAGLKLTHVLGSGQLQESQ